MDVVRVPPPPAPVLVRVDLVAGLEPVAGRRVVLASLKGPLYGWRALREPLVAADGHEMVVVVPEEAWWASRLCGGRQEAGGVLWPSGCVFVDLSS